MTNDVNLFTLSLQYFTRSTSSHHCVCTVQSSLPQVRSVVSVHVKCLCRYLYYIDCSTVEYGQWRKALILQNDLECKLSGLIQPYLWSLASITDKDKKNTSVPPSHNISPSVLFLLYRSLTIQWFLYMYFVQIFGYINITYLVYVMPR